MPPRIRTKRIGGRYAAPNPGVAYGIALAIISAGLLVPYAYFAKIGMDPFSFGLEQLQQPGPIAPIYTDIEWKLPFAILVWHLVFGFFLGALYDPSVDER